MGLDRNRCLSVYDGKEAQGGHISIKSKTNIRPDFGAVLSIYAFVKHHASCTWNTWGVVIADADRFVYEILLRPASQGVPALT